MTKAMTTQLEMTDHTAMITTMTVVGSTKQDSRVSNFYMQVSTAPAMTEILMEMPAMRTTSRGTAGVRTTRGTGSTTRSWSSLSCSTVL